MSRRRRRLVGVAEDHTHGVSVGVAVAVVGDNSGALTDFIPGQDQHDMVTRRLQTRSPRRPVLQSEGSPLPDIYSRLHMRGCGCAREVTT